MLRPDRQPRGEDPLLLLKMALFLAAATVAVFGMATQRQWVIFGGIVILGIAFLLRFLRPGGKADDDDHTTMHARHDLSDNNPQS